MKSAEARGKTWKKIKKYRFIYLLLLPIALYYLIFTYYPLLLGILNSFQESKMIGTPAFVGLQNYRDVLANPVYGEAFWNSIVLGVGTFAVQFPFGLAIALGINELRTRFARSAVQSVTYIPNLLSWSVVGSMWLSMLDTNGLVNELMKVLTAGHWESIVFMSEQQLAQPIMILSAAWKGAGYYAVLFLAAIVAIDPSIYEAAAIDGASRLRQVFSIILPNLVPTMKVIAVLASMSVLRSFDQVFVMGNSNIFPKVRTLLYLIYQDGILNFKIGMSTAAATLVLLVTMVFSFVTRRATRYDESYS